MKIIIDGDSCPYVYEISDIAKEQELDCVVVTDSAHSYFDIEGLSQIIVDVGTNASDYKIFSMANKDDIVVTNDIGLATLCHNKEAKVISPYGNIFNNSLLRKEKIQKSNKRLFTDNLCAMIA